MSNASPFEVMGIILITAIAVTCLILIVYAINQNDTKESKVESPINFLISQRKYSAEKFILEGHSYFFITHNNAHGFTAVHNFECPKCKPVKVEAP